MENHFAGSRNQSERRRRHLANDQQDVSNGDVDSVILAEFAAQNVLNEGRIASPETIGVLSRLMPRAVWPYPVLLMFVGGCLTALCAQGGSALTQNLAGLLLLFSSQLAVLISLVRETSDIDFRGRYRWWRWLGLAGFTTAMLMLTHTLDDVPGLVAKVVTHVTGPVHAARPALVVVPCVTVSILLLSRIIPDMGRCRWSQTLFVAATLTGVVRQMLIYTDTGDVTATARSLDMLLIGGSYLTFAALLVHSRFVAYVCNDPPTAESLPQRSLLQRSRQQPEAKATRDKSLPVEVSSTKPEGAAVADRPSNAAPASKSSSKRRTKRSARRSRKKAA